MAKFDKQAFIEATKEPVRLLVLAIIPFAIAYFTEVNYQWAGVALLVLRWIDKWLHESGVAEKGITRF
jgi:hypothetical protein